jgi:hypothetical protein
MLSARATFANLTGESGGGDLAASRWGSRHDPTSAILHDSVPRRSAAFPTAPQLPVLDRTEGRNAPILATRSSLFGSVSSFFGF